MIGVTQGTAALARSASAARAHADGKLELSDKLLNVLAAPCGDSEYDGVSQRHIPHLNY